MSVMIMIDSHGISNLCINHRDRKVPTMYSCSSHKKLVWLKIMLPGVSLYWRKSTKPPFPQKLRHNHYWHASWDRMVLFLLVIFRMWTMVYLSTQMYMQCAHFFFFLSIDTTDSKILLIVTLSPYITYFHIQSVKQYAKGESNPF